MPEGCSLLHHPRGLKEGGLAAQRLQGPGASLADPLAEWNELKPPVPALLPPGLSPMPPRALFLLAWVGAYTHTHTHPLPSLPSPPLPLPFSVSYEAPLEPLCKVIGFLPLLVCNENVIYSGPPPGRGELHSASQPRAVKLFRPPSLQPGSCGSLTMHPFASAPPACPARSGLNRARAGGLDSEAPRSPPPAPSK